MQDNYNNESGFIGNKMMEIVIVFIIMFFGVIVMWDSYCIGLGWGIDGLEFGFFFFYIGFLIVISVGVMIFNVFCMNVEEVGEFVGYDEFKLVMVVFILSIIYVVLIDFIGIYVVLIIFIIVFMVW